MTSVVIVQIWEWTPFLALVHAASAPPIPKDIDEAVMLETERWWPRFKSVILPYMWPGTTVALVFQTAFTVKAFGTTYSIEQGDQGPPHAGPCFTSSASGFTASMLA